MIDPDGTMIIASGSDGWLWFWDLHTRRPFWRFQAHKSDVVGLHYEGSALVTRGFAGEISRWLLPSSEQVIEAMHVK